MHLVAAASLLCAKLASTPLVSLAFHALPAVRHSIFAPVHTAKQQTITGDCRWLASCVWAVRGRAVCRADTAPRIGEQPSLLCQIQSLLEACACIFAVPVGFFLSIVSVSFVADTRQRPATLDASPHPLQAKVFTFNFLHLLSSYVLSAVPWGLGQQSCVSPTCEAAAESLTGAAVCNLQQGHPVSPCRRVRVTTNARSVPRQKAALRLSRTSEKSGATENAASRSTLQQSPLFLRSVTCAGDGPVVRNMTLQIFTLNRMPVSSSATRRTRLLRESQKKKSKHTTSLIDEPSQLQRRKSCGLQKPTEPTVAVSSGDRGGVPSAPDMSHPRKDHTGILQRTRKVKRPSHERAVGREAKGTQKNKRFRDSQCLQDDLSRCEERSSCDDSHLLLHHRTSASHSSDREDEASLPSSECYMEAEQCLESSDGGNAEVNSESIDTPSHSATSFSWGDAASSRQTFSSLGVPPALIRTALSLHITHPSPVQVLALPYALRGKNVCALAPTGSGKTLGYCWPLLQRVGRGDGHAFMGLVLLPARELAVQVLDQFRIYGMQLGVRVCLLLGGRDLVEEGNLLTQCPHVVIATPGRLADHIQNDTSTMKKRLSAVDVLVLDEADRLLSDEFEEDLKLILSCIPTSSQGRQTLLFSATASPALRELQRRFGDEAMPLVDAHPTNQPALPNLSHFYLFVPARMQPVYLLYLLEHTAPFCSDRGIVFAGSVRQTQQICTALDILQQQSTPLHSLMEQRKRIACLEKFRSETARLLVCTDVAGRGLDLPRVEFVINMQVPGKAEDYIHRTGRTARAGRKGIAVTFVDPKSVRAVHRIEATINRQLKPLSSVKEDEVLKFLSHYSTVIQKSLLFLNEIGFDEKADKHEEYSKAFKEARKRRRSQKAQIRGSLPV
ncbi:dead deah box helicase domain-containing protein [Cystoisospora suis]|uniref:Dead deah box helicase domain-containing protein n=1 Tax=Cystoisospora suis TaxID=483139 RepID=A0A2C6K1I4_9APIC|nr:dead deah box helicase domain-containing protein [Cystoisospora suis]